MNSLRSIVSAKLETMNDRKIKRVLYVGQEKTKFTVPTTFLSHPLFKILLCKSAIADFEFDHILPCSVPSFREVLNALEDGCRRPQHGAFEMLYQESSFSGKKNKRGFLAMYVGEDKVRFLVPTPYLWHPLFKILLEKAAEKFELEPAVSTGGLVVPCSVSIFREVAGAIEQGFANRHMQGGFVITKLLSL